VPQTLNAYVASDCSLDGLELYLSHQVIKRFVRSPGFSAKDRIFPFHSSPTAAIRKVGWGARFVQFLLGLPQKEGGGAHVSCHF